MNWMYFRIQSFFIYANSNTKVGEGLANYHGQLEIPHKGRAIKELVGCWVLNNVTPRK